MGVRQKGRSDFKLASLRHDLELITAARKVAEEMVDLGGSLDRYPLLKDELKWFLNDTDQEAEFLFKS